MNHELKIWPQYYEPVKKRLKTFEIRENDRGFQAGDTVTLCEWDPKLESKREIHLMAMTSSQKTRFELGDYTDSEPITFKIGYVLPIDDKRVVFSLLEVE